MSKSTSHSQSIPYGYCHCGCGQRTRIARNSRSSCGWVKGEPIRYISGHNRRIPMSSRNHVEVDHESGTARVYLINHLTTGKYAIVDTADLEKIMVIRWRLEYCPNESHAYAVGAKRGGGDARMHRFILDIADGDPREVDHIDGDRLNNTRANLRTCSRSENIMNSRKQDRQCTSQYKGVSWDKRSSKWYAKITKHQKQMHIGLFSNEDDAARAYDAAARELFGRFARLNFPDE